MIINNLKIRINLVKHTNTNWNVYIVKLKKYIYYNLIYSKPKHNKPSYSISPFIRREGRLIVNNGTKKNNFFTYYLKLYHNIKYINLYCVMNHETIVDIFTLLINFYLL